MDSRQQESEIVRKCRRGQAEAWRTLVNHMSENGKSQCGNG